MKKYSFILSLLLGSSLLFVACKKDDPPVTKSLLELASTKTDLSTFLTAMERAGLSSTLSSNGSFTVFAPTNAAFTAYLAANGYANLEAVPVATLKQLLQ
ncbi:MAG: fasciclin domain-containing protein, partial [Saprospiraceae bacterium]|nr:fasciclin domain-containing protein [Saprospiraceae bacterium]